MEFNLTPLECASYIFVYLAIYIWTKHGRRIRRCLKDYFRQRRGLRNLKPKSPKDCPACNRDCSLLLHRPKLEVLPWPERKSRRGRPKTIDTSGHACLNPLCTYFAIAYPAIHALVSNSCRGKQRIRYRLKALSLTGKLQTAFVERANLTLRELFVPLSRRTRSIAFDRQHLHRHI